MKNVKDILDKNTCILCTTRDEAEAICEKMHEAGLTWPNGERYDDESHWEEDTENICYYPADQAHSGLQYAQDQNYTILQASDFLSAEQPALPELPAMMYVSDMLSDFDHLGGLEPMQVLAYAPELHYPWLVAGRGEGKYDGFRHARPIPAAPITLPEISAQLAAALETMEAKVMESDTLNHLTAAHPTPDFMQASHDALAAYRSYIANNPA